MSIPRLAADLQIRFSIDALRQAFANQRVIVHQEDSLFSADCDWLFDLHSFHSSLRARDGRVQLMIVPPPREDVNWSFAPIARARQFMFSKPIPRPSAESLDNPRPLSTMLSTVPPRRGWSETRISVAFPWMMPLWIASCVMR